MPWLIWRGCRDALLRGNIERWEAGGKAKGLPRPEMPDVKNGWLRTVSHMIKSGGEDLEKRMKGHWLFGSYEDTIEDRLREPQPLRGGNGFCGVWYLDPGEVACLGGLLRNMVRWDPEDRWDAKAVVGHKWFANRYTPRLKPNCNFVPPSTNPKPAARYVPLLTIFKEEQARIHKAQEASIREEDARIQEAEEAWIEEGFTPAPASEEGSEEESEEPVLLQTAVIIMGFAVLLLAIVLLAWFGVPYLFAKLNIDGFSAGPRVAEPPVEPAPMPELDFELLLFVVPG
ncbi:hypothetical protein PG988_011706 [Apiospora saccharicola]